MRRDDIASNIVKGLRDSAAGIGVGLALVSLAQLLLRTVLAKDASTTRPVQTPTEGRLVAFPEVGGLHHRCERRAA